MTLLRHRIAGATVLDTWGKEINKWACGHSACCPVAFCREEVELGWRGMASLSWLDRDEGAGSFLRLEFNQSAAEEREWEQVSKSENENEKERENKRDREREGEMLFHLSCDSVTSECSWTFCRAQTELGGHQLQRRYFVAYAGHSVETPAGWGLISMAKLAPNKDNSSKAHPNIA